MASYSAGIHEGFCSFTRTDVGATPTSSLYAARLRFGFSALRTPGAVRIAYGGRTVVTMAATIPGPITKVEGTTPDSSVDRKIKLQVSNLWYQPPGCANPLLEGVEMELPRNSVGVIAGKSGSGKSTLLQVLAGLFEPSQGSILLRADNGSLKAGVSCRPSGCAKQGTLHNHVGLVFQFPERYFLARTVLDELTFGWPRNNVAARMELAKRVQAAAIAVGIEEIPLTKAPHKLSGGYKRRLALAVQLVRSPDLLLLDEPLAGLDWAARRDLVQLLDDLRTRCTILIVSHDLRLQLAHMRGWS